MDEHDKGHSVGGIILNLRKRLMLFRPILFLKETVCTMVLKEMNTLGWNPFFLTDMRQF